MSHGRAETSSGQEGERRRPGVWRYEACHVSLELGLWPGAPGAPGLGGLEEVEAWQGMVVDAGPARRDDEPLSSLSPPPRTPGRLGVGQPRSGEEGLVDDTILQKKNRRDPGSETDFSPDVWSGLEGERAEISKEEKRNEKKLVLSFQKQEASQLKTFWLISFIWEYTVRLDVR